MQVVAVAATGFSELCERCNVHRSHPACEPLRDRLQQPHVAVGIAERGMRAVRPALRIRTRGPLGAGREATAEVVEENLGHVHAVRDEFISASMMSSTTRTTLFRATRAPML